jgi:hypothetical protein
MRVDLYGWRDACSGFEYGRRGDACVNYRNLQLRLDQAGFGVDVICEPPYTEFGRSSHRYEKRKAIGLNIGRPVGRNAIPRAEHSVCSPNPLHQLRVGVIEIQKMHACMKNDDLRKVGPLRLSRVLICGAAQVLGSIYKSQASGRFLQRSRWIIKVFTTLISTPALTHLHQALTYCPMRLTVAPCS